MGKAPVSLVTTPGTERVSSWQVMPEDGSSEMDTFMLLDVFVTAVFVVELAINVFANSNDGFKPFYSAATNSVKNAMFENFFWAHHWFIVFFFFLLLHGPVFWAWSMVPLSLYAVERLLQQLRGSRAFVVTKVEWVKPVMAVKICPLDKQAFNFREGQYLYLNCPHISKNEWHPFTISSARGDLSIPGSGMLNPLRVSVSTGEEVCEVPRPAGLDKKFKWHKFCVISKDYRTVPEYELLDKHETCYHDYVSCHIKVWSTTTFDSIRFDLS